MPTTIQYAQLEDHIVGLANVERGQLGLTCITCGDRLIVKDGRGTRAKTDTRRRPPRTKHFSHTSNSQCHGEGPAHYRLKMGIAESIRMALTMPANQRNSRGYIHYRCPDERYGVNCLFKGAPPSNLDPQGFQELQLGYHQFDLLKGLAEVKTEARLSGGRTRADIAGFDAHGKRIWAIEIVRSTLSNSATENAKDTDLPLFVIDISTLPLDSEPQRLKELLNPLYTIIADNVARGFYPAADKSHNVQCPRKAFGMGPEDHQWHKERTYLHVGATDCTHQGDCPGCEQVLLHECNGRAPDAMTCPDTWYMFREGITPIEMYTQPEHLEKSHIPDFSNRFNPSATEPPPGWLTTVAVQMVDSTDVGT